MFARPVQCAWGVPKGYESSMGSLPRGLRTGIPALPNHLIRLFFAGLVLKKNLFFLKRKRIQEEIELSESELIESEKADLYAPFWEAHT